MSFSTVARCESEKDPCKRVAPNAMFAADRRTLMAPSDGFVGALERTGLARGAGIVFGTVGSLWFALHQRVIDQQTWYDTKAANTRTASSMNTAVILHKFPTL
jgi:hypothetical protein